MRIAVAAVQGAFVEHEKMLEAMGIEVIELRKLEDLSQPFDGLVLCRESCSGILACLMCC